MRITRWSGWAGSTTVQPAQHLGKGEFPRFCVGDFPTAELSAICDESRCKGSRGDVRLELFAESPALAVEPVVARGVHDREGRP